MGPGRARSGGDDRVKRWSRAAVSLDFVLDFGRKLDLAHFWPDNTDHIAEYSRNQVGRFAHPYQLVSILHSAKAFHKVAIWNPADADAAPGVEGLLLGNGEAVRRISQPEWPWPPVASERLSNGPDQPMLGYVDATSRDFFSGLERVPAIGEKRATRCPDEQECGAACETAKVLDVGKEGNEQYVNANSGKEAPELLHPIKRAAPGYRTRYRFCTHAHEVPALQPEPIITSSSAKSEA